MLEMPDPRHQQLVDALMPVDRTALLPAAIRHEQGHCFIARPGAGDGQALTPASRLVLFEDRRLLGPGDALHDTIRRDGGGCYSDWHGALYFSSSDGSDPRTNGRQYAVAWIAPDGLTDYVMARLSAPEAAHPVQRETLYAFYDKTHGPTTYDFLVFLYIAEAARLRRGLCHLHVIFVGFSDPTGFAVEQDQFRTLHRGALDYDDAYFRWRLHNILLPACDLFASCTGITLATSRQEARLWLDRCARHVFPDGYSVDRPSGSHAWPDLVATCQGEGPRPSLDVPPQALDYVEQWLARVGGGRTIVAITLRESHHSQARNSDLESWAQFVRSLDPAEFLCVVVRDTERALEPLPDGWEPALVFQPASWNLALRAALYELADANMAVNSGPCALMYLNRRVRYVMVKMLADSAVTTPAFLESRGMPVGQPHLQVAWHASQRVCWETDAFAVLRREFEALMRAGDAATPPASMDVPGNAHSGQPVPA